MTARVAMRRGALIQLVQQTLGNASVAATGALPARATHRQFGARPQRVKSAQSVNSQFSTLSFRAGNAGNTQALIACEPPLERHPLVGSPDGEPPHGSAQE